MVAMNNQIKASRKVQLIKKIYKYNKPCQITPEIPFARNPTSVQVPTI